MNDILFSPIRLSELEILIEKSFERVLSKANIIKSTPSSTSDIIFIDEVCRLTNLKRATIYALMSKGKIPNHKQPGQKKLLFSRTEILNWLTNSKS